VQNTRKKPSDGYTIADWKWEFLRRNLRYRRACQAIEWLKQRKRGWFKGFGLLRSVNSWDVAEKIQQQCSLREAKLRKKPSEQRDLWPLPDPTFSAHEYKYSPVQIPPIVGVSGPSDFHGYSSHPDADEPPIITAGDNEVVVVIDTRSTREEIVNELKAYLGPYLSKQRSQLKNYKDYLAVWDLRERKFTADKIAPKLWPEEYKKVGGRDLKVGVKGPLIQRVYDHEKSAQKLIEESFPPRKRKKRPPKIKK